MNRLALALCLLCVAPAARADEIQLEFGDYLTQVSGLPTFSAPLPVDTLSMSVEFVSSLSSGSGGAGSGKPAFEPIAVVRRFDAWSPSLLQVITLGAAFESATLTIIDTDAEPDAPLLTLHLGTVYVESITQGAIETGQPIETLTLRVGQLAIQHGSGPPQGWNVINNLPWTP